ncbi:DNA helicase PIF1, ATP-dependent [Corchorus olitorius]|uniref:ATP-dependent DNA helicase n=1 Tax=Corchorus olitorius TaxID=93759 RepID=A0A1R3KN73_9ROSI|nr:DNA helicase PIF1, ATP-dependent [Corchorus olitorius]
MFTEWFEANKRCENARRLFYVDFPTEWTWKAKNKTWVPRQNKRSIARIIYVHPSAGELYYMRLMLNEIRGATCYEDLRTVDGIVYGTFREACFALGMLGDDSEWIRAMEEASQVQTGGQLRRLFVTLILNSAVGDPKSFFEKTWTLLADDINFNLRRSYGIEEFSIPPDHLRNQLLLLLEDEFRKHSTSLEEYNLPLPLRTATTNIGDRLLDEELDYDRVQLEMDYLSMLSSLNEEQRNVYMEVRESVDNGSGGMYFVYGSGGTGKTYLWTTLISALGSIGKIVLAVASSGIASLLLPGGRTAHSRFKIPLDISSTSTCRITKNTQLARLIERTSLIIWDEAPMVHRNCIEALNKTLQDVVLNNDSDSTSRPFGGKTIVFGGDFRQILPVIPSGSKTEILNAAITSSDLWRGCKLLRLNTNMRLLREGMDGDEREHMKNFAEWLLRIGDGAVSSVRSNDDREGELIKIPHDLLVPISKDPISDIISAVYPDFEYNFADQRYLSERAIVTPYNETVDSINQAVLAKIPAEERIYRSADSISPSSTSAADQAQLYPSEFLNTLTFSGVPDHYLHLKLNSVIMLLRNVSPSEGLCNGTRLLVTQLCRNVIEAKIISGANTGEKVFIPRIIMKSRMSLKFISQLRPPGQNQIVKLRVIRLWDCIIPTTNKFIGISFLGVDEKGDAIHVQISDLLSEKNRGKLVEGAIHQLSRFRVQQAKGRNLSTMGDIIISFQLNTEVKLIQDNVANYPRFYFQFRDLEILTPYANSDKYMTDFVGVLFSVSEIRKVTMAQDGKDVTKIDCLMLQPSGERMRITVWESCFNQLDKKELLSMKLAPILLFEGLLPKTFSEILYLSSCSGTRIHINPNLPDHIPLEQLDRIRPEEVILEQESNAGPTLQARIEAAVNIDIETLLRMEPSSIGNSFFKCSVTIEQIDLSNGWYYNACNVCNKGLNEKNKVFDCRKHGIKVPKLIMKLPMVVRDESSDMEITTFDRHAEMMTGVKLSVMASKNGVT